MNRKKWVIANVVDRPDGRKKIYQCPRHIRIALSCNAEGILYPNRSFSSIADKHALFELSFTVIDQKDV